MATFYLSDTGNDAGLGDATSPFQSFTRAQEETRFLPGNDDVVVDDGTYVLDETIELTSLDSGTTWTAAPGATVIISGGGEDMSLITMDGVQDVALSGFTFTDTSGFGDYDNTNAAVYITEDSSNITISDSNFRNVDAGVKVDFGSNNVTVENSDFADIGGHAIDFNDGSLLNVASKNTITRAGAEYPDAAAIEMSESFGNVITGNVIKDSPRHAIEEQNWAPDNLSGGNLIEYNEIENYMLETEDGGAIYLFGGDDPITPFASTVQYNRIEGEADDFSWGIYFDDLVNGGNVTGNYVNGGGVASLMIHGGDRTEVTNNVFLNAEQYAITVQTGLVNPDDPILFDNIHHNIFAPDEGIFGASDARGIQFHDNIYVGGPDNQFFGWDYETFEEWQASGGDRGSIVIDSLPGFIPGGGNGGDNTPDLPGDFPGFNPDLPNFNPDFNPNFDPDLDLIGDEEEEDGGFPDFDNDEEEEELVADDDDEEVSMETMLSQLTTNPEFIVADEEEIVSDDEEIELDDDQLAQLPDDLLPPTNGIIPEETTSNFGRTNYVPEQDAFMLPGN